VKATIKVIDSTNNSGTPLRLDIPVYKKNSPSWTVYNELLKKHPPGKPPHPEFLKPLLGCGSDFQPVIFDAVDGTVIRSAALQTQDSAGPTGLDVYGWRRLCTSFQKASDNLCMKVIGISRMMFVYFPLFKFLQLHISLRRLNPGSIHWSAWRNSKIPSTCCLCCFCTVHGVCSKWTYFVHTILHISSHLGPLKDAFSVKFLPTLTGRSF